MSLRHRSPQSATRCDESVRNFVNIFSVTRSMLSQVTETFLSELLATHCEPHAKSQVYYITRPKLCVPCRNQDFHGRNMLRSAPPQSFSPPSSLPPLLYHLLCAGSGFPRLGTLSTQCAWYCDSLMWCWWLRISEPWPVYISDCGA